MTALHSALTQIEAWLAQYAPDTHATLAPGTTNATAATLASPELAALYAWHDGQALGAPVGKSQKRAARPFIVDGTSAFALLSSEEAETHKATLDRHLAKGGFDSELYTKKNAWHARWIPFAFTKPEYLVVDLEGCFVGGIAGQVVRVEPEGTVRMIVAPSVTGLFVQQARMLGALELHAKRRTIDIDRRAWTADPDHPSYPIKKHVDQIVRVREVPIERRLLDVIKERMSGAEVEAAIAAGARLDVTDANGSAPLHLAAQMPSTGPVEAMLRAGAEVDVQDSVGRTPLVHAVAIGRVRDAVDMVRVLVRAGASPDRADRGGTTPRQRAEQRYDRETTTAVLAALDEH